MKVKDLIRKLIALDPEAEVFTEALNDNEVKEVKQYFYGGENVVYLADDTEYLDSDSSLLENGEGLGQYSSTYAIDLFIEEDVPFTLTELMGVSEKDAEKVKDEILDKLCFGRGGDFSFFDYESYHDFLIDILKKHKIKYGD